MSRLLGRESALDPMLVGSSLVLVCIGAVMVGSASVYIGDQPPFNDVRYFFDQHLLAIAVGVIGMLVAIRVPTEWWNRGASLALAVSIGLLVLVLLPGVAERINGAKRWVELGPVGFQASELARLLFLVYITSYSVRQAETLASSFAGFLRPMLLVALASLLLILEPDFGATAVLTATSMGVLFLAGARLRDLGFCGLVAGGVGALLISLDAERSSRLLCSWWDPWPERFGCGYQLANSYIAIGSGDLFGAGLGAGVQKLAFLPDAHTDFIFAVLTEELGLVGASLVMLLFAMLVYRAFQVGRRAITMGMPFHGLLCMGIGLTLGLQAAVSIGVNTGVLPTKGLTLPLISYGRTSIVVTLLALGILFRAASEVASAAAPEPRRRPA